MNHYGLGCRVSYGSESTHRPAAAHASNSVMACVPLGQLVEQPGNVLFDGRVSSPPGATGGDASPCTEQAEGGQGPISKTEG